MANNRILLSLLFPLFLLFMIPEVLSVCAPTNKDVKVLKAQRFWQFEVSHRFPGCEPFHPTDVKDVSSTCIFYFSICTPVPDFCPENSGICLANKVDFSKSTLGNKTLYTKPINIGSFKEDNPFNAEPTYFDVNFDPGEKIINSSKSLDSITKIRFTCSENATWENSKDGKVPQLAHVQVNAAIKPELLAVEYHIDFLYKGACPKGGGGGSSEEPSNPLSVGSILLILFFPGMFLYCVVGALINRGAGKRGKEMIPNSKFWTALPGLISDGFSFVVAKITCSQMSTSQEPYDRM